MAIIAVTGAPGTGKTAVARLIAKKLRWAYVDVSRIIKEKKLCEGYDKKRDCKIIDDKKLVKELIKVIKNNKNSVIDSHMSQFLPAKYVDLCVVTKCELKILKRRLERRSYSPKKVRENLDAEIFDNCLVEAEEAGHRVIVVDTSKKVDKEEIIKKVKNQMKNETRQT